jgi:UV DNA damage repair endonuclease
MSACRCSWVTQSVAELEVHSRIFDEMGFLPASPYNKINIHVGGTYGGPKEDTLRRFAQVQQDALQGLRGGKMFSHKGLYWQTDGGILC